MKHLPFLALLPCTAHAQQDSSGGSVVSVVVAAIAVAVIRIFFWRWVCKNCCGRGQSQAQQQQGYGQQQQQQQGQYATMDDNSAAAGAYAPAAPPVAYAPTVSPVAYAPSAPPGGQQGGGQKFDPATGQPLAVATGQKFCGNCAAPGTGTAFCSNCGQRM